jgi:hypothetical protein
MSRFWDPRDAKKLAASLQNERSTDRWHRNRGLVARRGRRAGPEEEAENISASSDAFTVGRFVPSHRNR